MAWFHAEHAGLPAIQRLALQHRWHAQVWQLAWTSDNYSWRQGRFDDAIAMWRIGLTAADHQGDPAVQTIARRRLGYTCTLAQSHEEALTHLDEALALADLTGELPDRAHAHHGLAVAWEKQGDDEAALEHTLQALELYRAAHMPVDEAEALNMAGWYLARLGRYDQARPYCEAALTAARHHRHHSGEAATLDSLAYIAHHTGDHTQALHHYQQALTLLQDTDNTYYRANILDRLANTHTALGRHDHARTAWQETLTIYEAQQRLTDADRIRRQLADQPDEGPHDIP